MLLRALIALVVGGALGAAREAPRPHRDDALVSLANARAHAPVAPSVGTPRPLVLASAALVLATPTWVLLPTTRAWSGSCGSRYLLSDRPLLL